MKKIEKIDRAAAQELHTKFDMMIKALAKGYGLEFKRKSATFEDGAINLKCTLTVPGVRLVAEEGQEIALFLVGLEMGGIVVDKEFGEMTIIGYNKRARKAPVLLTTKDGRKMKCSVSFAKANSHH